MHNKIIDNVTTLIQKAFQYQMANFNNVKNALTFAPKKQLLQAAV